MEISVHDNHLLAYSVSSETREIRLQTVYPAYEQAESEYTDVVFTDVVAYHFEGDRFSTILFDVDEVKVEDIYAENVERFEAGQRYCWPGVWNDGKQAVLDYLSAQSIKGYSLSSSIGMTGWVLAKDMRFETRI